MKAVPSQFRLLLRREECCRNIRDRSRLVVGFCFSFPVDQIAINSGSLIRWTKGFEITGGEDKDPVALLSEAFKRQVGPEKQAFDDRLASSSWLLFHQFGPAYDASSQPATAAFQSSLGMS